MKKHSAIIKGLVFMAFFSFCIGAKAVLPTINLPHTFSGTEGFGGYIDVNNDGVRDFMLEFDFSFYTSGSGFWDGECFIGNALFSPGLATPAISPLNAVLAEEVIPDSPSPMLSDVGPDYTSILNYGDQIGSTPLAGMSWSSDAYIFYMGGISAPLSGNYATGKKTGYLGVKFVAADGLHYSWIPVTIDDDGEPSVTLGTPGIASTPDQGILAGSGTAVPIPLIASLLGFGVIGGGVLLKRKKKK